jgi:hypothetical protein
MMLVYFGETLEILTSVVAFQRFGGLARPRTVINWGFVGAELSCRAPCSSALCYVETPPRAYSFVEGVRGEIHPKRPV